MRITKPTLLFVLATSLALADDNPPPAAEKSAPPAEDALAAAKRNFDAIKSARTGLEQPKDGLPSLSAPEFHAGGSLLPPQSSSPSDPAMAKKSANWLVDAMMKPGEKESRDPRRKIPDLAKHERENATDKDPRNASETHATAEKTDDPQPAEKRVGPEFNPLTRYMAGWMTPQDYALLKPGLDGAASASLSSRGDPSLPAVGADLSVLGDAGSALDLSAGNKAAPFTLPKPADNPFLQSFNPAGAPAPNVFAAPPAPSSGSAGTMLAPVPADLAPAKSKIPDFAKPAADEKYFKQLKRF